MSLSSLSSSPEKIVRTWAGLALFTLAAAAVLAVLDLSAPGGLRRALVAHANLAGLLWPLTAVGVLAAQRLARQRPRLALAGLASAGVISTAVLGLMLAGVGKATLISFMPLYWTPAHPLLLVAALATGTVLLAATLLPGASLNDRETPGFAWLLLPFVVTLISLLWGWVASPEFAGHIRAELVMWAAGHAWQYAMAMLAAWTWMQLAGVGGRAQRLWSLAAALPALGVLVLQALFPIEQENYLRQLPALLVWTLWPVPLALVAWLLRDAVYRAAGGAFLWLSVLVFVLSQLVSARLLWSGEGGWWGLTLQHGVGLAVAVGLLGVLLRLPEMVSLKAEANPSRVRAFAVGGIVLVLVSWLLALSPEEVELEQAQERATFGKAATRKHVESKKAEEIRTRFEQGVAMMQMRQYDFAVQAFHRVLELNPTLSEAHVNMGFALYERGDLADAQRFFEGAIALNKNQTNAYYGLAIAANAQKNFGVAVGAMRAWLHLTPADDPFRAKGEAMFDEMQRAFFEERKGRGETLPPSLAGSAAGSKRD
jgi:tetratricopeptide (TPR) repeat protein